MPQFQPGDIIQYTTFGGRICTRQVSYMENEYRVRFTNGNWMRASECRLATTRLATKNLTGFAKWYKERVDASVSTG